MSKLPLSVAIITYNEEDIIGRTLEAVKDIASEIIVVDSHSTDRTREIAKSYGAKVYVEDWKGYAGQKNSALEKCTQEWILFLDADEVVSEELKESIKRELQNPKADGYLINRRTYYLGKLLKYTWQPEWRLFLVKRSSNPRWEGEPHARLTIKSTNIKKLRGDLIHFPYKNIREHFSKSLNYAYQTALYYKSKGKKFHIYNLLVNPVWAFTREYILGLAFLDGIRGFIIGFSYFFSTFAKYIYLWELNQQNDRRERNHTGL
ncbi:MAG: glycosyltransferase family 2 protein [Aquificae bacterium]|nr:glycosyltransferase family 2 protein [Aquificota bacterium]